MPDYKGDIYKVLKNTYGDSFNKTQEEFNDALSNNEGYSSDIYKVLKSTYGDGFTKSEEDFNNSITPINQRGIVEQEVQPKPIESLKTEDKAQNLFDKAFETVSEVEPTQQFTPEQVQSFNKQAGVDESINDKERFTLAPESAFTDSDRNIKEPMSPEEIQSTLKNIDSSVIDKIDGKIADLLGSSDNKFSSSFYYNAPESEPSLFEEQLFNPLGVSGFSKTTRESVRKDVQSFIDDNFSTLEKRFAENYYSKVFDQMDNNHIKHIGERYAEGIHNKRANNLESLGLSKEDAQKQATELLREDYEDFSINFLLDDDSEESSEYKSLLSNYFSLSKEVSELRSSEKEVPLDKIRELVRINESLSELRESPQGLIKLETGGREKELKDKSDDYVNSYDETLKETKELPVETIARLHREAYNQLQGLKDDHWFKIDSEVSPFEVDGVKKITRNENKLDELEGRFKALTRAYLLNEDVTAIERSWTDGFKAFGETLAESVANRVSIGADVDIKTDRDDRREFIDALSDGDFNLTKEQIETSKNQFGESLGDGFGIAIDIMADFLLTKGAGSAVNLRKLSVVDRAIRLSLRAKHGKLASNTYRVFSGGIKESALFSLTPRDELSGVMGFGEGSAQELMSLANVSAFASKFGGKYKNLLEFGLKTIGVGAGGTVSEFSGEYIHQLNESGFDTDKAFDNTFGKTGDEITDNILLTAIISLTMGTPANAKIGLNAVQDLIGRGYPKEKAKQLIKDADLTGVDEGTLSRFTELTDVEIIQKTEEAKKELGITTDQETTTKEGVVTEDTSTKEETESQKKEPQILTEFEGDRVKTKIGDRDVVGTVFQEGKNLVIEEDNGNIVELGNAEELSKTPSEQFSLEVEEESFSINEFSEVDINGKKYTPKSTEAPLESINYDNEGNLISVTLQNEKGQDRTFRGKNAEEVAYAMTLQELDNRNVSEGRILEETNKAIQDGTIKKETEPTKRTDITPKEGTIKDTEQSTETRTEKEIESLEDLEKLNVKDKGNLERIYNTLDAIDKRLGDLVDPKNMNEATRVIPALLARVIIKGIKAAVKSGMTLEQAIKKAAVDNNVKEQDVKDTIFSVTKAQETKARQRVQKETKQQVDPTPTKKTKQVQKDVDKTVGVESELDSKFEQLKNSLKNQEKGQRNASKGAKELSNMLKAEKRNFKGFKSTEVVKLANKIAKGVKNNEELNKAIKEVDSMIAKARKNTLSEKVGKSKKKLKKLNKKTLTPEDKKIIEAINRDINETHLTEDQLTELLEIVDDVLTSRSAKVKGFKIKFKNEEIIDSLNRLAKESENNEANALFDRYSDLIGDDKMSLKEMKTIVNSINKGSDINEKRSSLFRKFIESSISEAESFINKNTDGLGLSKKHKDILEKLSKSDKSILNLEELKLLNNIYSNAIINGTVDGYGRIEGKIEGDKVASKIAKIVKDSSLRDIAKSPFTKFFKEKTLNTSALISRISRDRKVGEKIHNTLIKPNQRGFQKTKRNIEKAYNDISEIIKKHKKKDLKTEQDKLKVGIVSILNQGDFNQNIKLYESSLNNKLKSTNKKVKKQAEDEKELWDSMKKDLTKDNLLKSLNKGQTELYNYMLDWYGSRTPKMKEVTEEIHGGVFNAEENYIPRKVRKVKDGVNGLSAKDVADNIGESNITKETISTKESDRIQNRTAKESLREGSYYETNPLSLFRATATDIELDINTLKERLVLKEALKNPKLSEVLGDLNTQILANRALSETTAQKAFMETNALIEILRPFRNGHVAAMLGDVTKLYTEYLPVYIHHLFQLNNPLDMFRTTKMLGAKSSKMDELLNELDSPLLSRDAQGEEVINSVSNNPNTAKRVSDNVKKMTSWAMRTADKRIAKEIWLSSYITELKKQGKIKNFNDFDLENPIIDKQAATSADAMVTNTVNESERTSMGELFSSNATGSRIASDVLFPLKKFTLNQTQEMILNIRNLTESIADKDVDTDAVRRLMGQVAGLATFNALAVMMRNIMYSEVSEEVLSMLGYEPKEENEEDKKRRTEYRKEQVLIRTLSDIVFGGVPAPIEAFTKKAIDHIREGATDKELMDIAGNKGLKLSHKFHRDWFYNSDEISGADVAGFYGMMGEQIADIFSTTFDIASRESFDPARFTSSVLLKTLALTGLMEGTVKRVNDKVSRRIERDNKLIREFKSKSVNKQARLRELLNIIEDEKDK